MPAKNLTVLIGSLLLLYSCSNHHSSPVQTGGSKTEIEKAEKDFAAMAADKGIAEAFWFYADSNAVIKRNNDSLIHGKENIRNYYTADFYKTASVTWSPDFIEVSESGDMGYTYGKYMWQTKDSTGKITEYKGVFHTVWKNNLTDPGNMFGIDAGFIRFQQDFFSTRYIRFAVVCPKLQETLLLINLKNSYIISHRP